MGLLIIIFKQEQFQAKFIVKLILNLDFVIFIEFVEFMINSTSFKQEVIIITPMICFL